MDANPTNLQKPVDSWIQIPDDLLPPPEPQQKTRFIPQLRAPTKEEQNWRHAMWEERRAAVATALRAAGASEFAIERFHSCGAGCSVEFSRSLNKARLRASYCHCRHCEPCMRSKANTIASNVDKRLRERPPQAYRFMTFTLKHTDTPLRDQVKKLLRCFKKLRQLREWKQTQVGGLATLEVKWSPAGSIVEETGRQRQKPEWHPHLHVISEGNFIHWRKLRELWLHVTGDSTTIDIRPVKDRKMCVHYVVKYVTKGTSPSVWFNDQASSEWICSIKGIRTVSTYGNWRGISLTKADKAAEDWRPVCTLTQLLEACRNNEAWAIGIFNQLRPDISNPRQPKPP